MEKRNCAKAAPKKPREPEMEERSGAKAAPKKPRALPKAAAAAMKEQDEREGTMAAVDLDAFRCPLCFSLFEASVFQCKNGHVACKACIHRVCSSCGEPIGDIRCRPLEDVIAVVRVRCAFAEHGCKKYVGFAGKAVHEALFCQHAPCACPVPGCAYAGPLLHEHIRDAHADTGGDDAVVTFAGSAAVTLRRSTPFRVLLHALDARVFLLLNGGDVPSGRSLSVVCVGPRPAGNRSMEYKLQVGGGGGGGGGVPGPLALSASGPVPCMRFWAGHHPTEGFLFVPDAYWSSSGSVSVTVHVQEMTVDKASV